MTAPWLPGSCGTATQMAWARRVARSARGASRPSWPYLASGAISVSRTGRDASGARRAGLVDGGVDGGEAALDQDREPGGVPAARRGGVGGPDRLPGQAGGGGLLAHGVDQQLGHVQLDGAVVTGQHVDGLVQLAPVDAQGEERAGGGALRQPVGDRAAADQFRLALDQDR